MTPDEFPEYHAMRARGGTAEAVFLAAERQHGTIPAIRIIRAVFGISLSAAKEATIRAHGLGKSLDEYQESLLPAIKEAMKHVDEDT